MKRFIAVVLFCVLTAVAVPTAVYYIGELSHKRIDKEETQSLNDINVFFHNKGTTEAVNIETYLCGVVAAEMPASFEIEALKAQAVAARSYTYYRKNNPTKEHPEAAVCTDFSHCKAYVTKDEMKNNWGDKTDQYFSKVKEAVFSTEGKVVTYNGEIAMTVFHSQSGGGRTENSKDVWGGDVPYLVSVESHGEETAPNFYSTAEYVFEDFKNKLFTKFPEMVLNSIDEIGEPDVSDGGSVKKMKIGNIEVAGKDLRSLFGLRSTCFKIKKDNNKIVFEVTGYGHGVGMSQYGANAMAKEGHDYIEILKHYYTGTQLSVV